jgi:hypothetical protein
MDLYACACGDTLVRTPKEVYTCCVAKGYEDLRPRDWSGKPVDRQLVDDLADVLARTVVGWSDVIGHDLAEAPEVKRVLARYRRETGVDG